MPLCGEFCRPPGSYLASSRSSCICVTMYKKISMCLDAGTSGGWWCRGCMCNQYCVRRSVNQPTLSGGCGIVSSVGRIVTTSVR